MANSPQSPRAQKFADDERRSESIGRRLYDTTYQQYDRARRLQYISGYTSLAAKYKLIVPRLDALFHGRFETFDHPDPIQRVRDNNNRLQRFHPRSQQDRLNKPESIDGDIKKVAEMLQISFYSGYEDPIVGLPFTDTNNSAQTLKNTHHSWVEIHLAIELAQPLLRDDLTTAELMGLRFRLAITLLHEFAPLSELGYSFSSHFWGGNNFSMMRQIYNRGGPGLPNLGFFQNSFFTSRNAGYATSRGAPSLPQPVPAGQLDSFFTYDYWKYLFANGDLLELALDTMRILPESTFYRYIRDHGGIDVSAHELRSFLHMASDNRELFIWEPFPGSGTVMRIPVGWPSRPTSTIYPPANTADEGTINQLDSLMGDAEFREKLYQHTLEMWDLDIEYFRIWLMSTDGDDMWDVDPQDFEDVVVQSVAQGSSYFTLGPKGIIRFCEPDDIEDIRAKYASKFALHRLEHFKDKARNAS
ncbi:hypothetical protein DL95DRAFT_506071 [Leptodontidium sp. 2 PMI_412]|nr:hypothetical protein DL95DRAFT_506071 [Leptodontidium sp. 2 PMI_412]